MIHIGTSGYSYQDWKGPYYPEDIKDNQMLPFYAQEFKATEINYTYYRMPAARVPADGPREHLVGVLVGDRADRRRDRGGIRPDPRAFGFGIERWIRHATDARAGGRSVLGAR